MKVKPGASLKGVKDVMFIASIVVEDVYEAFGFLTTITSGTDSMNLHGGGDPKKTKHDDGEALDYRTRGIMREMMETIAAEIRVRLGIDYDVVIESNPYHLHIEYDPKGLHA